MVMVWVTLSAFVAGVVNAVAGGGTFLTFPVLTGFAHLSDRIANITSTDGLWPGSAASVAAAWGEFKLIPRGMLILFSLISILGGTLGSVILLTTDDRSFELAIPWLLAFATALFAFSKPIARWAGRHHGHRTPGWTILVGLIQFVVAVYGGYFGAGIGVLMLAGLSFAGLDSLNQTNALKVLLSTLINGVAAVIFLFGPIRWDYAIPMAVASSLGGFFGMAAARKIKPDQLRGLILLVGVGLTVAFFWKNYARHGRPHAACAPSAAHPANTFVIGAAPAALASGGSPYMSSIVRSTL
ncbi:MAG TPA: sulfite exporter TauE/SafE family protein [Tepidisphaeraceae bacterium]|jgi:hypothetical protein|nr:sulfite exporter TauE/SafE family protein [Tepidisphaeraceae bacterium]